jgi:hypothetical protein
MTNLTVFDFGNKGIRFERRGDRMWVSLTDMAKATGKQVNDYTRSKSATLFIEEFESVTGIPVTETVQGGNPEKQGTWAIEEVAIDFAAWCSVGFRIWVSQQIRTLMSEGTVSLAPEQPKAKLGTSVEATAVALNPLRMLLTTVPDALVEGFLLNEVQRYHPELKASINAAHSLLDATNPIPEILLTPTAISQRLGVSARVVNAILTANDYQIKNPSKGKTEPAYLPTEKGKEYSSNTIATGRGSDNTSYQHTKWNESIVSVVKGLM